MAVGVLISFISCSDDRFSAGPDSPAERPRFSVGVMSSWQPGAGMSRASDDTSVAPVDSMDEADPMYLVTDVWALNDSAAAAPSRGTTVKSDLSNFPAAFGLSAMCYSGNFADITAGDYEAGMARNVRMVSDGASWGPAEGEDRLDWPGTGRLHFFAYAPYASAESGISVPDETKPVLKLNVPADPANQADLLTATADCSGNARQVVALNFGHALAAVTFKVSGKENGMLAGTIKKVEVAGVYGTGTTVIGTGKWTTEGDPRTFTVESNLELGTNSDPDNPFTPDKGEEIAGDGNNMTLFMIPQTLPSGATLRLTMTDKASGTERVFTATIGDGTRKWEAGKIYTYSLSTDGIIFTPVLEITDSKGNPLPADYEIPYSGEVRNVRFNAYVRMAQADGTTGYLYPQMQVQYAVDGGSWEELKNSDGEANMVWLPKGTTQAVSQLKADYSGAAAAVDAALPAPPAAQEGSLLLPPQSDFTQLRRAFGTITGNGKTRDGEYIELGTDETANCYMVNRYGNYLLPLIYGNARKGGAANPSAYTGKADGLKDFVKHDDTPITKPEIDGAVDAILVWQDAPGLVSVDSELKDGKLSFRVNRYAMTQGNAVVAVRDADKNILWSWHIWVTHYDWTNTVSSLSEQGNIYKFAPCNLGYCDRHDQDNPERQLRLKFIFNYGGKTITIDKIGDHEISFKQQQFLKSLAGDNTYYQFGRKDPMLPAIYEKWGTKSHPTTGKTYIPNYIGEDTEYTGFLDIDPNEFTMMNKQFFDSEPGYEFRGSIDWEQFKNVSLSRAGNDIESANDGVTYGQATRHPHWFILGDDKSSLGDCRIHWHTRDFSKSTYLPSTNIPYNAWNSSATGVGKGYTKKDPSNEQAVSKTVYDPSPAGFHIPPVGAFSGIVNFTSSSGYYNDNSYGIVDDVDYRPKRDNNHGYTVRTDYYDKSGGILWFPSTGMRDTNVRRKNNKSPFQVLPSLVPPNLVKDTNHPTWGAYCMITYLTSCTTDINSRALIFHMDLRKGAKDDIIDTGHPVCGYCYYTHNSYGLSVRPVKD